MALAATRLAVHNRLTTIIEGVSAIGHAYNRVRRPKEESEKQIQDLFNDSAGILNVAFIRWIGKLNEVTSFDDLVAVRHIFEIEYRYAWNERDDDNAPSELIFNANLDLMDAAIIADKHIGLDRGVSTNGFEIQRAIERDPQPFYAKLCHTAYARVMVVIAEC